jgi:putative membrane protein
MKRMCFLSLTLAAALTIGCRGDNRSATTTNPETGAPVGTTGASDVSRGDKDFVNDATIASMAEIELGRIAQEKGMDPNVKKFGQMMIDDHTKASEALKTIATEARIEMPAQVDDDHKDQAEKLAAKSGADFDREYAEMMLNGHENFVGKLESRIDKETLSKWKAEHVQPATGEKVKEKGETAAVTPEKSDNPVTFRLNQWAADTYPVAYAHLQAAKDLQNALKRRMTTP